MRKHRFTLLAVVAALTLQAAPAVANECQQRHDALGQRYERALEAPAAPDGATTALNALEDDIFAAMDACTDNFDLLKLMGEVQIAAGRAPIAVAYGNKLVQMEPQRFGGHLLLGAALTTIGRTDQGLHHMTQAEALAPDNLAIKLNLCGAHAAAGNRAQAISYCELVAEGDDPGLAQTATSLLERMR